MGKRPLVSFTLALLSGLFFSEAFFYFPMSLSLALGVLLLAELVFFRARLLSFPLFLAGILGFLIHQLSAMAISPQDLRHYVDQGAIRIIAQVSGPLQHDARHVRLQMKARTIFIEGDERPLQGDFHLNIWKSDIPFAYGDQLKMEIRLRRPKQFQNIGVFQYADYLERTGLSAEANLSNLVHIDKVGEGGNPLLKQIFKWRDVIRRRILKIFEPESGALLMALVIGETGYLPDEVREHFTASGTAHLLAVSGAHLAFVSLFVFGLMRFVLLGLPEAILLRLSLWKIPSQWAALFTAGAAIFYTLLAGAKIGTLRALTMILIYLLSIWMGRSRDLRTALALAALLIILFEPGAVFEISFQLSFLSVLFIFLMLEWQRTKEQADLHDPPDDVPSFYQRMFKKPVSLMMYSTLGATLGTLPLTLYYFQQFSWVGLISNVVVLPLLGWFIVPLGLLSALGALFFSEGFPLVSVIDPLLSYFYALITFFSDLPGAGFHFASPPLWLIILYYIVFISIFIRGGSRIFFATALLLFGLIFFGWGSTRRPPAYLRVTFLDVAQGDASLIEFANGKTLLIDGGTENAGKFGIAPYLRERRIRTIDILVATHPQFDHIGGLPYLMRTFKIGALWSNGQGNKGDHYQNFLEAIRSKGLKPLIVNDQTAPMKIDDCTLSFLNPPGQASAMSAKPNNQSIVLHLSCVTPSNKTWSFLFASDIEAEVESALIERSATLKSDVIKVPHHGSRSSSGPAFLSAVSPRFAIISAGRKNRYRHPHKEVLAAYETIGTKMYRSDQDGAIIFEIERERGDEDPLSSMRIRSYRESKIQRIKGSVALLSQEWANIVKLF